jgi:exodeoxyribonuclease-1
MSDADFSFYWHDYETFGSVPRRDRPVQFAGVRTDADLNEIGEPLVQYCRPAPDCLPEPEACLITGITPQQGLERGVAERDFAAAIEAQLATPGTVGVGYNSIRFDDEVTRFLFWRNLIDPYAREWRNGCGRWDLLDVVRCARALRPEGIEWPTHPDGKPSLKLEHLSAANGLAHEAAHDALCDVRATIALARLLRTRNARLWDFCLKLRHKEAVTAELGGGRAVLHVSGMYAAERGCLALVVPLGAHPQNRNEVICWDLAADPAQLADLDAAQIRERLFTRGEDLPDGVERLPIKTIHINRSPIVIGNLKTLSPERAEQWGIDLSLGAARAESALRLAPQLQALWPQVFARERSNEPVDVDEDLYGGFVSNEDRRTLERLRPLGGVELAAKRPSFDDARLEELLFRYRARNFPESLDDDEAERWRAHREARLFRGVGGALTLERYAERIDALAEAAAQRGDERAEAILSELHDYAEVAADGL